MRKTASAIAVVILTMTGLGATTTSASAASGPSLNGSSCEALGYKKLVNRTYLQKDGFGDRIAELRTLRKTGSNKNRWCTYVKKTGKTVGVTHRISLRVTVLTGSGQKSKKLSERVKRYTSSFTYTSLSGKSSVKKKQTLNAKVGLHSTQGAGWYRTAYTRIG